MCLHTNYQPATIMLAAFNYLSPITRSFMQTATTFMHSCKMETLLTIILIILFATKTPFGLQNIDFVTEFALYQDVIGLIMHTDENVNGILSFVKQCDYSIKYHVSSKSIQDSQSGVRTMHLFLHSRGRNSSHLTQFQSIFNKKSSADKSVWLTDLDEFEMDAFQLNLDLDDDVYFYNENGLEIILWEVYRVGSGFPLTINQIGTWSQANGLYIDIESKWVRRQNLQGVELKIQSLPSFSFIKDMIPNGNGTFQMVGILPDIMYNIQSLLNFTMTVTKPPDKTWGSLQPNGKWNGMVRQLIDKNIDIAVADFARTAARSEVISFGHSIMQSYKQFFIQNPSGTLNIFAYLDPFQYYTWIVVLTFCLCLPPFLYFVYRYSETTENEALTFNGAYAFTWANITVLGWNVNPSKSASRIAILSICFGAIILYFHWESMLISHLAAKVVKLPFTSLQELIDKTQYRIFVYPGTSAEDKFKLTPDHYYQMAWNTRIKDHLDEYRSYKRPIDILLADPQVAAFVKIHGMSVYKEYATCKVIATPARYELKNMAFGFQKHSPYLEIYNHYIKELKEKGTIGQIFKKYSQQQQDCPNHSGGPLGYNSCFSAFAILLAGGFLGICALFVENLMSKLSPHSLKNRNMIQGISSELEDLVIENQRLRKEIAYLRRNLM